MLLLQFGVRCEQRFSANAAATTAVAAAATADVAAAAASTTAVAAAYSGLVAAGLLLQMNKLREFA